MIRFLIGLVACLIAANCIPSVAGDDDPIREKLDKAKADYDAARKKYSEDVAKHFDKREKAARNKENKSLVDRNEAERKAFQQTGDLPVDDSEQLRKPLNSARLALGKAFKEAVGKYTKLDMDDEATKVENELKEFLHDRDAPWVKLFNGVDKKGWQDSVPTKSNWSVANGTLSGNGGLGYLITERNDYANFRLRVEAKLIGDGTDSGLCFRVQNAQVSHAYEANIHNGGPGAGSMGTLGMFLPNGGTEGFAMKGLDVPAGQWFTMEVLVEGNQFTTWVDGEKACQAVDPQKRIHSGHIALQQWTGNVNFRKVEIKELADPFLTGSVWLNDAEKLDLTVVERKGESFRAIFKIGQNIEREVTGTMKAGELSWFAKDVRPIKGRAGGDHRGTLIFDKDGYRIDFVWQDESGGKGNFTLRPPKE